MKKTFAIVNDLRQLDLVHETLTGFLADAGVGTELAEEMFLVAEEVIANTISYGYEDEDVHRIELALSFTDGLFRMRFRDDAKAFDPLAAEAPDLDAPTEERGIGGLGIHLVRTLTDDASYRREGDANILTVERRVS